MSASASAGSSSRWHRRFPTPMSFEPHGPRSTARLSEPSAHRRKPKSHDPLNNPANPPQRARSCAQMTGAGCGIGEINLPQHSIKWREKSGLEHFKDVVVDAFGCKSSSSNAHDIVQPTIGFCAGLKGWRRAKIIRRGIEQVAARRIARLREHVRRDDDPPPVAHVNQRTIVRAKHHSGIDYARDVVTHQSPIRRTWQQLTTQAFSKERSFAHAIADAPAKGALAGIVRASNARANGEEVGQAWFWRRR